MFRIHYNFFIISYKYPFMFIIVGEDLRSMRKALQYFVRQYNTRRTGISSKNIDRDLYWLKLIIFFVLFLLNPIFSLLLILH